MDDRDPLCVPVCVRDGEPLVKILVGGIEFQLGVTEFLLLVRCASADFSNASAVVRPTIADFLTAAQSVCELVCSLAPPASPEQNERNRTRWAETGIGGVQAVQPILSKLAEINAAVRRDWATEREAFAERGGQLFA